MSTVASALSIAGTRTSGAPIRTQNGKQKPTNARKIGTSAMVCAIAAEYLLVIRLAARGELWFT